MATSDDPGRLEGKVAIVTGAAQGIGRGIATTLAAGGAWDLTLHEWRRTIDVNLTGTFLCSQAAIPAMTERGGGSIVSISSHSSWLGSPGMSPAYNASKAGIIGLSAALAVQLGGRGIRSNAVCPGAVRSRDFGWTPEEDARRASLYTLGLGQPEDIGGVIRFLASPLARWVTGSVFYVHGGFLKEEYLP